jgi:hypothetical protein
LQYLPPKKLKKQLFWGDFSKKSQKYLAEQNNFSTFAPAKTWGTMRP